MASLSVDDSPLAIDSQGAFDNAIHKLINFSRPSASSQKGELNLLLSRLVTLCKSDSARWRTFVLTLTHKRYHFLSPECRQEAHAKGQQLVEAGEGERLIFYSSFRFLFELAVAGEQEGITHDYASLLAALEALIKIAPHAGGSRDVCQLLVDMVQMLLTHSGNIDRAKEKHVTATGGVSLSMLVSQGVSDIEEVCKAKRGMAALLLGGLLQLAADTLDEDFEVIERNGAASSPNQSQEFPSTLHVFVPHRDRGRSRKRKGRQGRPPEYLSERQLVNSVAEILLWSRTRQAASVAAFSKSRLRFLESASKEAAKQQLTVLQTVVRGLRKKLNTYARERGFMLSNQFSMDASVLSSRQINCGKASDLADLTRLAKKKGNSNTLKLIQLRGAAGKATKFSSVREALSVPEVTGDSVNEIEELERDIYIARLKATLTYLRSLTKTHKKSAVVASMEKCQLSHALAVLVAASMMNWDLPKAETEPVSEPSRSETTAKLFIGGAKMNMASMHDVVDLLGRIAKGTDKNEVDVPSFMDDEGGVTTKAVMNTIDRHVQDSEVFLLVTGADIHLPSNYMKALSDRGCSMHCHDVDDIGDRLQRELAQKGDVTISLSWDTLDDLDLHVFLPSEEKVWYQNKRSKDGMCGLDVDMNAGGASSKEPVENVFLGNLDLRKVAPLGHYKVVIQNYAYHGSEAGTPVPFRVVVEKNGIKEKYDGQCTGAGKSSNVVVCEFDYAGRSVPFPGDESDVTAFAASDMVNITASTGQTLDSLGQLVQVVQQHEHIGIVRPLLSEDERAGASAEAPQSETRLEVTSQDRTIILLAKLPARFHRIVGEAFGGSSLAETCAESIARRMVADRIGITELKRNGFPTDIVEAVKAKMATLDVM